MSREWSERHIRDIIRDVYNENFNVGYIDRLNKMLNANAHTVFRNGTHSENSETFKPVKVEYYIDKAEILGAGSTSDGYIKYYPYLDFHGTVTFMESPFRKENFKFYLGYFQSFLKFETDLGPILPIGEDVNARIDISSLWWFDKLIYSYPWIPMPEEYGRIVFSPIITDFLYHGVNLKDYDYKSGLISPKGETVVPFKGRNYA